MNGLAGLALAGLLATLVVPMVALAIVPAVRRHRRERAARDVVSRGRWPRNEVLDALDRHEALQRREIQEGARTYLRANGRHA